MRVARILPHGWRGLARQLSIWTPFYLGYELSHGLVTGARHDALRHAHAVVDAERSLGIFRELDVQQWTFRAPGFVLEVAKFTYFQCQFTFTFAFVLWVYLFRTHGYRFLRNALLTTFMCALPGYVLYPTAPPRMLQSLGFQDPLNGSALSHENALVKLLANPYAAMPSLHTATALLVGFWGIVVTRRLIMRVLFGLYPALVVFSIVATANHFILDAVAGAVLVSFTTTGTYLFFRRTGRPIFDRSTVQSDRLSTQNGAGDPDLAPSEAMTTSSATFNRFKTGYTDGARRVASRAVASFSQSRVTPNQLTAVGFAMNVGAAVLVYRESYIAAAIIFIVGSLVDILDGALARLRGEATPFGAFLDSTTDRVSEGAMLCAVTLVLAREANTWAIGAVFVALVSSFLISYTRAKAEVEGVDGKAGLMGRAERVALLGIVLLAAPWGFLPYGIALLAALTSITVVQRSVSVYKQLTAS